MLRSHPLCYNLPVSIAQQRQGETCKMSGHSQGNVAKQSIIMRMHCSPVTFARPYAEAMASLLDPEDRYFGGRIIAAGGGVDGPDGPSALHNKRLIAGKWAHLMPVCLGILPASHSWLSGYSANS
jgi:hypothetical protein